MHQHMTGIKAEHVEITTRAEVHGMSLTVEDRQRQWWTTHSGVHVVCVSRLTANADRSRALRRAKSSFVGGGITATRRPRQSCSCYTSSDTQANATGTDGPGELEKVCVTRMRLTPTPSCTQSAPG